MPKLTNVEKLNLSELTADADRLMNNGSAGDVHLQGRVLGRLTRLVCAVMGSGLVTVGELETAIETHEAGEAAIRLRVEGAHHTSIKLPGGIELNGFAARDVTRLLILAVQVLILLALLGWIPGMRR